MKVEQGLVLIQDADRYNPRDYKKLLKPFEEANADVVYGSRFLEDKIILEFTISGTF